MALADPQSVTINAVAQTLPRMSTNNGDGLFRKDDRSVQLQISHAASSRNRTRSLVRLTQTKIAADPLTSVNVEVNMSVHIVIDRPLSGFSNTEQKQLVDALAAYLTASSGANTTKIIGGES